MSLNSWRRVSMKIKMAATMLLCSFVILCSEVNAAGSSGQLLQSADCGCEAAPVVEDCGCGAPADDGCGCRKPVRGLLSKLRSGGCGGGCGCEATAVPAPVVDCGCDVAPVADCGCDAAPVADCGCDAAPVADCGCDAAPSCGCKSGGIKGLLQRIGGNVAGDCGCGPTCEEPAPVVEESCGCAPEPVVEDCGCEEVAAPAPSCGCFKGGLLGRLGSRGCGCGSAPAESNFGGVYEPVVAPAADCGCEAAPVADCGCEAAPVVEDCGCEAAAPSCGCKVGGLLGRLRGHSCGCRSAAAPVADCGCDAEPAPVADCGCDAAPAADCGCDLLLQLPIAVAKLHHVVVA